MLNYQRVSGKLLWRITEISRNEVKWVIYSHDYDHLLHILPWCLFIIVILKICSANNANCPEQMLATAVFFGICLISSSILLVDGFILQKMGRGRVGKKFKQSGDKRHGSAVPRTQRASRPVHNKEDERCQFNGDPPNVHRSGGPFPDAFSMGMGHYAGMSLLAPPPKGSWLRDDTGEKSNFPGKSGKNV